MKAKVLFILSQPTQNIAPFKLLAEREDIELLVAYCTGADSRLWRHEEYVNKEMFDLGGGTGYRYVFLRNVSPRPTLSGFFGVLNLELLRLIRNHECIVVFGHGYLSCWLAILAAKLTGKSLILSNDATALDATFAPDSVWRILKRTLKRILLPLIYNRIADAVLVPSTAAREFLLGLGVSDRRIVLTPYTVDNEMLRAAAVATDRKSVRKQWNIPECAPVALFCGKLVSRKCPLDLLRAFAAADVPDSFLVFVGEGPEMDMLRSTATSLQITDRVRFLGLVPYAALAQIYASADLLIHPAEHEPFGLIINEAMVCGTPVLVSDKVGAGKDLVKDGETGYVFPARDERALTAHLRTLLQDPERLRAMGDRAAERMSSWSPASNADATIQAIHAAAG